MDAGLHAVKTTSKQVVYKGGENANDDNIEKQEPVEDIIIPLEKNDEVLTKLRKVL